MNKSYFLPFGILSTLTTAVIAEDLAIVVGKGCPVSEVSSTELTKIFKCEKTKAADGSKLTVVVRSGGSEHGSALASIYKTDVAGYNKYFLQATFTGTVAAAPKALSSGDAVKAFVAETPGGISYVKASDIDANVKALKVDGKAPGEAGYPLQVK
jgi:ABC-type phosphate transport system substrate-binding protein